MMMTGMPFVTTTTTAAWLLLGSSFVVSSVTAKIDWETHYDNLPAVRFTEWTSLPLAHQGLATTAGYDATTWNAVSTAQVEFNSWADLTSTARQALEELGMTSATWDCYINHYQDKSWAELVDLGLSDAAEILGYNEALWTNDGITSTDALEWEQLTDGQAWAAAIFCYFADTWDETPIDQMQSLPTPYPYFRYRVWEDLEETQRSQAVTVGWTEETWNSPFASDLAYNSFGDLGDDARTALLAMGFSEETYDCYVDHYYGYTWEELQEYDMAQYFEELGWTQILFEQGNQPPMWSEGDWSLLNDVQKAAADELCWFQEIWESTPLSDWAGSYYLPAFRYQPWEDLTLKQGTFATSVGWTADNWNVPGTADFESFAFDDLTDAQKDGLRGLGFWHAEQYDCVSSLCDEET
jgi:hypothetical protein